PTPWGDGERSPAPAERGRAGCGGLRLSFVSDRHAGFVYPGRPDYSPTRVPSCSHVSPWASRSLERSARLPPRSSSTAAPGAGQTGRTVASTWPRPNVGGANFDAVMAVAFHPDGKRVGFGTADGSLWLWEPVKLAAPEADGRTWSAPVRAGRFDVQKTPRGEL